MWGIRSKSTWLYKRLFWLEIDANDHFINSIATATYLLDAGFGQYLSTHAYRILGKFAMSSTHLEMQPWH